MAANERLSLVLFCHPEFWAGHSMIGFGRMLRLAYQARGHNVRVLSPTSRWHSLLSRTKLAKWGAYVDEYVLFPREIRKTLNDLPRDSLFVFCDQALGPWVPLVADRPHVVHVHDLLALRSALGGVAENPVSVTGRIYQRYIRRGFRQARNFISVSNKTREDLHRFGAVNAVFSDVVPNGLAYPYCRLSPDEALWILVNAGLPAERRGMLLHVGGNQWYKNRRGVIAIYAEYAARVADPLPLWCIGRKPAEGVMSVVRDVPENGKVFFFHDVDNRVLQAAYSMASTLLFPSLAEGFGWPIIEAQACGCPVITTDEAPMNEVAGNEARYLPRLEAGAELQAWAARGAGTLQELLCNTALERAQAAERAIAWAKRYDADAVISRYLASYRRVLEDHLGRAVAKLESANTS